MQDLEVRSLKLWGQPPPAPMSRLAKNPTLLFSWWCTMFSAVIIVTRLCGRKTRSNRLFREDWIMMAALVPLFIRMACIHPVLLYGTNNVQTVGVHYTHEEIVNRSIGSRLVLAARIFYAMFIWISKLTVSEFLKRITIRIWRPSYEMTLQGLRIFLFLTFFGVVIATLTECQPFDHYWQVVPDPGPHCRQGYGNLITMGVCDIVTDILLVAFPIPIILNSGQNWRRKLQLALLFSLSLILIAVTASRVPEVVKMRGKQQFRTVWASCEILASTAVSNAVILGAFLRDKGTKRNKFRTTSVSDSIDRASVRRPTLTGLHNTGSEEDLFRFLGIRVPDHLKEDKDDAPRPAPAAVPAKRLSSHRSKGSNAADGVSKKGAANVSSDSDESLPQASNSHQRKPSPASSSKQETNLFDIGGLLEEPEDSPGTRSRVSTLVGSGHEGTIAHDFAASTPAQSRRGSRAFLQDIGGLLSQTPSRSSNSMDQYAHGPRRQSDSLIHPPSRHLRTAPTGVLGPMLERHETHHSLQDAGGLLGGIPETPDSDTIRRMHASEGQIPPPTSARLGRTPEVEQYSLQDLGGLLSEHHVPDASAAALLTARSRSQPQHALAQNGTQSSSHGQVVEWEHLDIPGPKFWDD